MIKDGKKVSYREITRMFLGLKKESEDMKVKMKAEFNLTFHLAVELYSKDPENIIFNTANMTENFLEIVKEGADFKEKENLRKLLENQQPISG